MDFLDEPRNRGGHIAVALQVMEYGTIVHSSQHPSFADTRIFVLSSDALTKLFAAIHRFPGVAEVLGSQEPKTQEMIPNFY